MPPQILSVSASLRAKLAHFGLRREAGRTDASWLCFPTTFERTQEGAFPRAGTLALFADWQRWPPSGVILAGACVGALQGVPRVAHKAHGVPALVGRASSGYNLPIRDAWEPASGGWKRERNKTLVLPAKVKALLHLARDP